ncbi:protein translocase subunit SecDF [Pedobacter sp. HMF7647]|uniref:Multifunctional fusion protein n=1 Tax=Hufsiella arboris TaxID=2695275 RepID=A0A7K1YD50_9SPHI|nr:protein translocase subunit SecDF [Hufsiella arboris]MXV52516.1 protein translocase subunit SecDF [Hufsiella arboris]
MQGKGLIKFVAIALAIACLYSLSFTWVAKRVENQAKEFAKGDPIKEKAYLDSIATQPVYNLGFTKFNYQYVKEREIPLGLDLKGGMNVTMEISLVDLVRNLANNPADANFNKALANADADLKTSQKDFITLFGEEYEKLEPNGKLAQFFATRDNANSVKITSSNSDVLKFLQTQSTVAIDQSFNILRTRIDKFGVTAPNIQRQQGTNRILIELPGVSDPTRVRKLLQGSAKLEFWETYDNTQIFPLLENVNKIVASTQAASDTTKKVAGTSKIDSIKKDAGSKLAALGAKKDSAAKDTGALAKNAAQQAKQNPLFALLAPATYQAQNGQQALRPGPIVGYAAQKDTAKVNSYLTLPAVKSVIPSNIKLLWGVKPVSADSKIFELYAIKVTKADGTPALGGDVITDAKDDIDQRGNPEVVMYMNPDGARDWKRLTAAASSDANNKQSIAIVLDDVVYSAPTVQNEIPNGISSISGHFELSDTKDLANVLKAGRLPAPAKIVSEAIVGPSLGETAIHSGLLSSVIGLLVVLVFMIFYYNRAGTVANVAVFVNIFFLMGVLASVGAVLTLPGIAGIVLTMGMAVDANVLIYERIREELGHGKSLRLAVADGYKHALPSILDGQITTFLTGVILYIFGSGPILGFATTLMIGIITSLFCSIFISRIIFEWMLSKDKPIKFSNPWSSHTFKNAHYGFVKNRKIFYIVSGLFITAGLISMFTRGFSLGVDFKGGRTYVVSFDKPVDQEKIREVLDGVYTDESNHSATEVKTFGSDNQLKITTSYMSDQTSESADKTVENKLEEGLSKLGVKSKIESSQKVGPTIANDLKTSAIWAVIFSIIVISIYILVRFRKWQFSLAAIVATTHDALLVLSFFSLFNGILPFSLDIDQAFIAAILTVIGYSINDTVVVMDRIREYLNLHHAKTDDPKLVINDAINSTLSRTVITALTVFFVLIVLFIFGGEVIRGFSFALLIGVVFGTYSSICVATPVIVDFGKKDLR